MKPFLSPTLQEKDLIVFDLDGTLAESKSPMDPEMSKLFRELLEKKKVAIISGGKYEQFQKQVLAGLRELEVNFEHLFLFPTTANSFYRYEGGWKKVYGKVLTATEKREVKAALEKTFEEVGYAHPQEVYGEIIEDRDTQITFSALGQDIVDVLGEKEGVRLKKEWAEKDPRPKMLKVLAKYLPKNLEAHSGGLTSIDITEKGIDKAYGLGQIEHYVGVPIAQMLFVGDRIFPGGNDYPVVATGVAYVEVENPAHTKELIRFLTG